MTPPQVQTTTMCVSVSLSGSVVLGCLFAPKLHIILFQPQKNVVSHRAPTSRFSGATTRATPSLGQGQHPPEALFSICAPSHLLLSMGATPWGAEVPWLGKECSQRRLDRRGRGWGASFCSPASLAPCPLWRSWGWVPPPGLLSLGSGSQSVPTVCNGREVVDSTTSSL